jgi:hypothetical protein
VPRRPAGKKAWFCFGAGAKVEVPLLDDSLNSVVGGDLEKESPIKEQVSPVKPKTVVEAEKEKEKEVDGAAANKGIRD